MNVHADHAYTTKFLSTVLSPAMSVDPRCWSTCHAGLAALTLSVWVRAVALHTDVLESTASIRHLFSLKLRHTSLASAIPTRAEGNGWAGLAT